MSKKVMVLAPHCDDETLGAGGTIRRHVDRGDEVSVVVATGGSIRPHPLISRSRFETVQEEARAAMRTLGVGELDILTLEPVLFPDGPLHVQNRIVHEALEKHRPDVLYVPFPYDLHNDHRALFHAASVAWRPTTALGRGIRQILAYEVISETHWQAMAFEPSFSPNIWIALTEDQLDAKVRALECYSSQMRDFPATRSVEAAVHLARYRGSQMNIGAAEAFVLVRGLE